MSQAEQVERPATCLGESRQRKAMARRSTRSPRSKECRLTQRCRGGRLLGFVLVMTAVSASAQPLEPYSVPRTVDGHPDFQGVWGIATLTMLERPPGIDGLIASPEAAAVLVENIRAGMPAVVDPDVQNYDIDQLVKVKGEYRTSVIVSPADGRMPFTRTGLDLAAKIMDRDRNSYEGPDQRPLVDRCMEALAYAPIRTVPVFLPRQIFQTRDYVAILAEDAVGLRMIPLNGVSPNEALRSVQGYSSGGWEGDTLVVTTTHLRADDPARNVLGRPLLLSRDTRITERFTRVSATELFYRFTVEDDGLYTEPWSGELSLTKHDVLIYEYACHEGNYSMTNTLLGGRAETGADEAPTPARD